MEKITDKQARVIQNRMARRGKWLDWDKLSELDRMTASDIVGMLMTGYSPQQVNENWEMAFQQLKHLGITK